MIGGETFGYGYNGRNRMTVVQRNGGTVGTYTYNALGQRTAKVATLPVAISQRFVYDEGSQLLGEYSDSTRDYIWLDGIPVATVDTTGMTSTVSYVHVDGLNTPRAVADGSGNTIWQLPYRGNAFGEQQPSSSNGYTLNLRFPGQYYDAESGLLSWGHRSYEAATGRSSQSDPIGLFGGQPSTYAYVHNNPTNAVDPDGLKLRFIDQTPDSDKRAFAQAIKYLNSKGVSSRIADLEALPQIVYINTQVPIGTDRYNSDYKLISWNPYGALETTNGGCQTPAMGFLHEAEHAYGDLTGTMESATPIKGSPYDNKEEKGVRVLFLHLEKAT